MEFTNVSRAVGKAKSHLYRQFIEIWQILWRIIVESLHINTSPICDKWYCWEIGTQNYRRNFFCAVAVLLGPIVEYHPISAKGQWRLYQFGKKVSAGVFLWYTLYAGRIWKGDILIADTGELEILDASEIHARRLNAKEVLTPKNGQNFHIPDRRWNSQIRGEEHNDVLQGESDGSQPLDKLADDSKVRHDFWTIAGNYI